MLPLLFYSYANYNSKPPSKPNFVDYKYNSDFADIQNYKK